MYRRLRSPAAAVSLLVVGALLAPMPSAAAGATAPATAPPSTVLPVPGRTVRPLARPADHTATVTAAKPVRWPAAGNAVVKLRPDSWVRPAGLPVALKGPGSGVRVQVLDRTAAGRTGHPMVLRLTGGADPVGVRVDYSGFAEAYGGSWASRLTLVQLPECALSTPTAAECAATPLPTVNDGATSTVSATVAVSPTAVVALASTPSSGSGDYTATTLQASATWSAGGGSGDFTWSYPMRTPPSLGGPAPQISLAYSSQLVDGKTAASNAQPSWIGEGFDYWQGAIVRTYQPCSDDGQAGMSDECWGGDNATLMMSGKGGELIQSSTSPDVWRLRSDDGTRVERITGGNNADDNGEYWKVTTTDGMQYFFGLGRLPGWTSGKPVTGSVWTVPVFGDDSGEPCHQATFAAAYCSQAYQWNLDYIVDPHGNTMSLWYNREFNSYGRAGSDTAVSSYIRGGSVAHIDYGTRLDSNMDSEFASGAYPPQRVVFGTQDRCVTQGSTCTSSTPANWPDVPWDLVCTSTTSCPAPHTPTFFTQKMLSTVTTQVWTGPGDTYKDADTWTLNHVFKDPGDQHAKILWLETLSHRGSVGGTTTVPDIAFTPVQMNNRVDISGSKDPITRFRLVSIADEYGSVLSLTYSPPDCVPGSAMPTAPDTNTRRCFPVYWAATGSATPTLEYFHKYVITTVTRGDLSGGASSVDTAYAYSGTPMWHYDEAEFVPVSHRTWGQWRGYSRVRITVGASGTAQSQTDTVYFRGMNGDKLSSGTRTATIPADPDFGGSAIADEPWRAGQVRETIVYNGTGDTAPVVSKTLDDPWQYGPTATRTRNGVTLTAYAVGVKTATAKTALDGGRGWRTTKVTNTFDYDTAAAVKTGRVIMTDDAGDTSTAADDRCTRTTYAENAAATSVVQVARAETVGVACAATPDRSVDVLSDVRNYYDGATAFGTSITRGDLTRAEELADWNGGHPVYATTATATYDAYGRTLTSADALGHTTVTAYQPASGAPVTSTTSTNPMGWTSTTTIEPAWGKSTAVVDANGARTDLAYDALGRLTSVWLPDRAKATQTASVAYTYVVRNSGGPTAVSTSKLNPAGTGYVTAWTLYDGLLRVRQTQAPAPGGGRDITDIKYDSRGLSVMANGVYYDLQAPSNALFVPTGDVPACGNTVIPGCVATQYDNAGRATAAISYVDGVEQSRTTTAYGGDHLDVAVPAGGTATSSWIDARGQQTSLRQYHGNTLSGAYDATSATYTRTEQLATFTDAAGNIWRYTYDQRGRRTRDEDPDRGATTYTYDDMDKLLTSTDARGITLTRAYDALGRQTSLSQGTVQLASWTFDTLARGELTTSTRYANGNAYTDTITGYDAAYRPTGHTVTIPAAEGGLAGSYTSGTAYNPDGSLASGTSPAAGGLPAETVTYGYSPLGLMASMAGLTSYVTGTYYDPLGRLASLSTSDGGGKTLTQTWAYEDGTGRTLAHSAKNDAAGTVFQDVHYTYDPAGNIKSVKDHSSTGPDDNQCFQYDYLRRLTAAWTPASGDCSAAASVTALGGPAPYWLAWTYGAAGNRKTQTSYAAAGATVRTSSYPAPGGTRPHTPDTVTTTGPAGTATDSFAYDVAGNTIGRPGQTLAWSVEGNLAAVTQSGSTTEYLYDTAGVRLIERDSGGTTLYLGGLECRAPAGQSATCTRYYQFHGSAVAARTVTGLRWLVADHQNTSSLALDSSTLNATVARHTPFGGVRGTGSLGLSRGFVGGITESSGLVAVGIREYDPDNGRFLSRDPLIDFADPQSVNGYAYADNSPVTNSDPSGAILLGPQCGPDGVKCHLDAGADPCPSGCGGDDDSTPVTHVDYGCEGQFFGSDCYGNDGTTMKRLDGDTRVGRCHILPDRCDPPPNNSRCYTWSGNGTTVALGCRMMVKPPWSPSQGSPGSYDEAWDAYQAAWDKYISDCLNLGACDPKKQPGDFNGGLEQKPDTTYTLPPKPPKPPKQNATVYGSIQLCFIICITHGADADGPGWSISAFTYGFGVSAGAGINSARSSSQDPWSGQGCFSFFAGGCVQGGTTSDGTGDGAWMGGGLTVGWGLSFSLGPSRTLP